MQKWQTRRHTLFFDRFVNIGVKLKTPKSENIYKQYIFNVNMTFSLLKSGEMLSVVPQKGPFMEILT